MVGVGGVGTADGRHSRWRAHPDPGARGRGRRLRDRPPPQRAPDTSDSCAVGGAVRTARARSDLEGNPVRDLRRPGGAHAARGGIRDSARTRRTRWRIHRVDGSSRAARLRRGRRALHRGCLARTAGCSRPRDSRHPPRISRVGGTARCGTRVPHRGHCVAARRREYWTSGCRHLAGAGGEPVLAGTAGGRDRVARHHEAPRLPGLQCAARCRYGARRDPSARALTDRCGAGGAGRAVSSPRVRQCRGSGESGGRHTRRDAGRGGSHRRDPAAGDR